jgi:hypothetical protein
MLFETHLSRRRIGDLTSPLSSPDNAGLSSSLLELTLGVGKLVPGPESEAADPDRVTNTHHGVSRFDKDDTSTPFQDPLCVHRHLRTCANSGEAVPVVTRFGRFQRRRRGTGRVLSERGAGNRPPRFQSSSATTSAALAEPLREQLRARLLLFARIDAGACSGRDQAYRQARAMSFPLSQCGL